MDVKKENDLLEETLSISETDYAQAYRFLLGAYEKEPGDFGPADALFSGLSGGRRRFTERSARLAPNSHHGKWLVVPPGGAGGRRPCAAGGQSGISRAESTL